eukprot:m.352617 g.352617  ORF g.352617 m.352617 type:complete len:123 (-) comp16566_c0_seq1:159-527(-)
MKTAILATLGAAVLGYCIYFDYKRRSHPQFKEQLMAKRKAEQESGSNGKAMAQAQMFLAQGTQLINQQDPRGLQYIALAVISCPDDSIKKLVGQKFPPEMLQAINSIIPQLQAQMSGGAAAQ